MNWLGTIVRFIVSALVLMSEVGFIVPAFGSVDSGALCSSRWSLRCSAGSSKGFSARMSRRLAAGLLGSS